MSLLGIDLGGTKAAFALFDDGGNLLQKDTYLLGKRKGSEVGSLITSNITRHLHAQDKSDPVKSVGISVPGISHSRQGTVWAPNIGEWENYPLLKEAKSVSGDIPVTIDSDRACSILGELWKGNAQGCLDAIFITVGTGIGAGILTSGEILRGASDIAGAVGWMGMKKPFLEKFRSCGCFEYYASGTGITRLAAEEAREVKGYKGVLSPENNKDYSCNDVFAAYEDGDPVAVRAINQVVFYWGMASANLVSIFNPEKVIFGGGVFGPARPLIPLIRKEAENWAQPVSMKGVSFEASSLSGDAALIGAGCLALRKVKEKKQF
ncbi:MAG TPA: ROK family protein [Bacteroidales bacterium]|nr:ROK family protein [Bacteroidales bacterium]